MKHLSENHVRFITTLLVHGVGELTPTERELHSLVELELMDAIYIRKNPDGSVSFRASENLSAVQCFLYRGELVDWTAQANALLAFEAWLSKFGEGSKKSPKVPA